ncbi:TIGR02450 family Trp-rich protein [Pseudomonas rossensis]|uniref:TIGR02450 family Trp-rich protein n=1 Tax=Pseudomonas rossensis TaxID=2305471 RepID=UPI003260130F
MNRINPIKLLLSKWTAAHPQNREKHFLITELFRDEQGTVLEVDGWAGGRSCRRLRSFDLRRDDQKDRSLRQLLQGSPSPQIKPIQNI